MKKSRKFVAFGLALICMLLFAAVPVHAKEAETVAVKCFTRSVYATALELSFSGSSDLKTGGITITYNPEVLRFETITSDAVWSDGWKETESGTVEIYFEKPEEVNCGNYFVTDVYFTVVGPGDTDIAIQDAYACDSDGNTYGIALTENIENATYAEPDWTYDERTQTLTISGEGITPEYLPAGTDDADADSDSGDTYTVSAPWSAYADEAKTVVVSDGITGIGENAFGDFNALEKIVLPDSIRAVADSAFPDCTASETITLEGKCLTKAERYAYEKGYQFVPNTAIVRGDLDGNGYLDAADALSALRMVVRLENTWPYSADVDESGVVDTQDALLILQRVVKLTDPLPITVELRAGDTYTFDGLRNSCMYEWVYTVTPSEGISVEREYLPLPGYDDPMDIPDGDTPEQVYTITADQAGTYTLDLKLQLAFDPNTGAERDVAEEIVYIFEVK